jgi:phosphatidylserine/phosphatidylglycerophosphate/cardiolipin synthase-like enzyme
MKKSLQGILCAILIILSCIGCSNGDGLILAPKEVANSQSTAQGSTSPVAATLNPKQTTSTSSPVAATSEPASASPSDGMEVLVGQKALDSAVSHILNAKSTIDMDMYEFTNSKIIAALEKAQTKGVKERIVLDISSTKAADELKSHGIDVHIESVNGGIDHVKMLWIDQSTVLLGSVNFGSGSGKNEDASVWQPVTKEVITFFDTVWSGKQPSMNGPTLFNGTATQDKALSLIANAKKSIVVGMFAWTDMHTVDAIIKAAQKGIQVTLYIDGHQKENDAAIKKLKDTNNINLTIATSNQWLHLKGMVVDDLITLMGSANWSYNGFHKNHELNFITSSAVVAKGIMDLLAQTKSGT